MKTTALYIFGHIFKKGREALDGEENAAKILSHIWKWECLVLLSWLLKHQDVTSLGLFSYKSSNLFEPQKWQIWMCSKGSWGIGVC